MEKIPFFALLRESWYDSFSHLRSFLFGLILALPVATQFLFPSSEFSDPQVLLKSVLQHTYMAILVLGIAFSFFVFGKVALIRKLFVDLQNQSEAKSKPASLSFSQSLRRLVLLELAFTAFLLLLHLVLSLPLILFWLLSQEISAIIVLLIIIIIIPVLCLTYIIRQFSYYYFLLTPLSFRSALEQAASLFLKHRFPIMFFACFYAILYGVFTSFLNFAMLGGVVLLRFLFNNLSESIALFLIGLMLLSWYTVLSQSLWLRFFLHLAAPKRPAPEESPLVVADQIPESPTA